MRSSIPLMILFNVLVGCEESLPPRIPPDPGAALEPSFGAFGGVVFFANPDTVSQSVGGSFHIEVKNLHDEFLSGVENIRINIEFWEEHRPGTLYHISGDRNSLVNQYDRQGDVFLLDGDVLSLAPDSSAQFLLGWDHVAYKLYEDASPRYGLYNCPTYPRCSGFVTTDSISLRARGTIRVFEQETVDKELGEIVFTIFYFFEDSAPLVLIEGMQSSVDSLTGFVRLEWTTWLHYDVSSYGIERYPAGGFGYSQIGEVIPPMDLYGDTLSFDFVDPDPPPGINRYRLGVWKIPRLFTRPLLVYYLSFPPVFVP